MPNTKQSNTSSKNATPPVVSSTMRAITAAKDEKLWNGQATYFRQTNWISYIKSFELVRLEEQTKEGVNGYVRFIDHVGRHGIAIVKDFVDGDFDDVERVMTDGAGLYMAGMIKVRVSRANTADEFYLVGRLSHVITDGLRLLGLPREQDEENALEQA